MTWNVGAGLEGRGVIVTGATGGIGAAVTQAFAAAGAKVLAVDLDASRLDDLISGLDGSGHFPVAADLRDVAASEALVQQAFDRFGQVYVLAYLAGVLRRGSIDDVTEEDWDFQNDINLKSAFFLSRAAAGSMRAQEKGGRIILFSSQGWWTGGFGGSPAYAASKGGITSLCRSMARTYGPHRITVNCVSPGQVHTSMLMDGINPVVYENMKQQTPLGYIADPEDVVGPVIFLASDHAKYITGATLNVSGGFLMY